MSSSCYFLDTSTKMQGKQSLYSTVILLPERETPE